MEENKKNIRVLLSMCGLDGHDRGIKLLANALRDAGMEVVYLGFFQTPESIARAALEEGVDVVGVSFLNGYHLFFTPKIVQALKDNKLDEVLLIEGGSILRGDIPKLKEMGVKEVFRSGATTQEIVEYIRNNAGKAK